MSKIKIEFSDLLFHYHSLLQEVHRMWNYLAVAILATLTIISQLDLSKYWSNAILLLIIFEVYAFVNMRLIVSIQKELFIVSEALRFSANEFANDFQEIYKISFAMPTTKPVRIRNYHLSVQFVVLFGGSLYIYLS